MFHICIDSENQYMPLYAGVTPVIGIRLTMAITVTMMITTILQRSLKILAYREKHSDKLALL